MLISEVRKFIYIAVPKTGSTSIEAHLTSLDPTIQRNRVLRPDGTWVDVHKHASAAEIKSKMGELFEEYSVVAFIRDPVSTAVSKYYHYRSGRGAQRAREWKINNRLNQLRLRVLSTLILPLPVWVRIYPYSMTHKFLMDDRQNMLIDVLGNFENLQDEFERVFSQFGFSSSELMLPHINQTQMSKSKHENEILLEKIIAKKAAIDMQIFRDRF